MLKFEALQVDTHVAGIEPSAPVKVLYVKKAGDAAAVTYELFDGRVLKKTFFQADEAKASLASETRTWVFDAKPDSFKLAAEATRLKLAHLFDPMMAVHTSDVEPLPHQISAVYESMLPRQPLRFVLADDPGAGKTSMAGLFAEVVQNVIEHFTAQYGTEVSISVDIAARSRTGVDVKTIRIVKENAATMKFKSADFETE